MPFFCILVYKRVYIIGKSLPIQLLFNIFDSFYPPQGDLGANWAFGRPYQESCILYSNCRNLNEGTTPKVLSFQCFTYQIGDFVKIYYIL
ncbi:unnamed protein product, partial [Vitis vinifera]|uniref:Uncharacterized protein n=1 Tax=Vitis vinifera TaxID=29760 RepID=D7SZZ7_VITVI